ncbi:MAG: molybdenum cofactor biosynthesis protein MoaE [Candidatus Eremiobacteraeota bacterium]|nr:molybdenum cofactor biosynthesis protein MoaE [Candidatus Eremiobacteraeota bacterium]
MFAISHEPIDAQSLAAAVGGDACGALVTFIGIVRARSDDGRLVTELTYEAQEGAAVAEFGAIAEEAKACFGPCDVSIVHRVGALNVGEIAVAVAVAAPHRASAFDACEFAIDQLKLRAPIWKKESFADGSSEWRENTCAEEPI